MAYGQQTAYRVQETKVSVPEGSWVALQGSTALEKRFAIKVFNAGTTGATRLALSYDNTIALKDARHWMGAGGVIVEPASTGLTLYGRAKVASGINSIRVFVTEYGA